MKLFICGSRNILDKKWIFTEIEKCISENNFTEITVLEGEASGVDLIAKEWAISHGIPVKEYPPDVKHYLHNACHKRNEAMAIDCDFMLDLWTGKTGRSLHDILMAEKHHKPYKVCIYDDDKSFCESVYKVLAKRKDIFTFSEDLRKVFPVFKKAVGEQYFEQK